MAQFAAEWLEALWMILAESGPYLLVGFVIAGFLSVFVPAQWVARRLGGDDVKSVATASIIGVPVPLCSCSVIPTATQLRRSGASRGATTAFLIATPETGVDSIGATWALMDPLMTVVRPVAAFVTAFASGVAVNLFGKGGSGPLDRETLETLESPAGPAPGTPGGAELNPTDTGESAGACCAHMADPEAAPGAAESVAAEGDAEHVHDHADGRDAPGTSTVRRALRYAFGTLLDDLTPWFLIGFALSGLIVVLVPDGFFQGAMLTGWLAMLAMLVAGVPLYVCATASTPIAAAMMAKGLEPGAALVFLLAGPATNVATILVVRNLLGKRALVIYLATIAAASLAIGWIVNRLYPIFGLDPTQMDVTPDAMDHGIVSTVSGAVLALLLARSAWRLRLDRRFGAWSRRVGRPAGLDPTAAPFKLGALATVVLAYGSTAITEVRPGETVFAIRFGEVVDSRSTPGPLVHLPWPMTTTRSVANDEVRAVEFGVDRVSIDDSAIDALALRAARAEYARLRDEAEMLTGEGWLVAIEYAVQYRVADSANWAFGFSDPEGLLRRLSQESIRRATATRRADDILVESGSDFRADVEASLSQAIQDAELGATLVGVELLSVHAPAGVHSAYRSIASALVERETFQVTAERRRIERLSEARMFQRETVQEAKNEALERTRIQAGVSAGFRALAEADRALPGFVAMSMSMAARLRAFEAQKGDGRQVIVEIGDHIEVVPLVGAGGTQDMRTIEEMMGGPIGGGR